MKKFLKYANSEGGKHLLYSMVGLDKDNDKIIKLSPNSFHVLRDKINGKNIIESHFLPGNYVENVLTAPIVKMDIAKEWGYEAFLHHAGLIFNQRYSLVTLDTINSSAGDGSLRGHNGGTWAQTRAILTNSGGDSVDDSKATDSEGTVVGATESDRYYCVRGFLPFDTSSIPGSSQVATAGTKVRLYITAVEDHDSVSAVLVGTTQASGATIAVSDFGNFTLNSPTEMATRKTFASMNLNAFNDWDANDNFVSFINKTGTTKFGMRSNLDVDNTAPTDNLSNSFSARYSENASNKPELVVVYSSDVSSGIYSFFM
jgi:hypothetical protein